MKMESSWQIRLNNFFFKETSNLESLNLMRKAIYLFLLFDMIIFLPYANQIFGPESMIIKYQVDVYSTSFFFNLLFYPPLIPYYYLFLIIHIVFIIFGLMDIFPRWSSAILFFTTLNITNRMYLMNTAGELLIVLLLFFLIFISHRSETKSEFKTFLNNIFSFACFFQLVIVYFFAAVFKITGVEWQEGSAVFYSLMMDEFSHSLIKNNLKENNLFLIISTYLAWGYQFAFPVLIWFKKMRKYLLVIGITFHLGIAFFMGLFNFGIIMVIAYIMYMDNEKARKINSGLNKYLVPKFLTKQKVASRSSSLSPEI